MKLIFFHSLLLGLIVGLEITPSQAGFTSLDKTVGLTEAEKTEILAMSNALRSQSFTKEKEPAADMMLMTWSDELAKSAQAWADKCDQAKAHDSNTERSANTGFTYVGQNVQRVFPVQKDSARLGMEQFYKEKDDFNITAGCQPGKVCGHFTQMQWAQTNCMGCGYNNDCKLGDRIGKIVCNYGPAGNIGGQKMYNVGPPCSQCPKKANLCYEGMCVDRENCPVADACICHLKASDCQNGATFDGNKCICNCATGFKGIKCESVCKDSGAFDCATYKKMNPIYCDHPTLKPHCDATCSECGNKALPKCGGHVPTEKIPPLPEVKSVLSL